MSVVRAAAVAASVKVVVRDGERLDTIAHYGRSVPAELRTALELGDPERLDGARCTEAGCDRRYGLEWDHVDPVAHGGMSSYENLEAKCAPTTGPRPNATARPGCSGRASTPRSRGGTAGWSMRHGVGSSTVPGGEDLHRSFTACPERPERREPATTPGPAAR